MRVDLTNNINIDIADNYRICHDFTRDVIIAASDNQVTSMIMNGYTQQIRNSINPIPVVGATNRDPIIAVYREMIANRDATPFDSTTHANVPAGSLIIFDAILNNTTVDIAHSMIKIENDKWQGANNIASLGIISPYRILNWWYSRGTTGVFKYPNMSRRRQALITTPVPAGGWCNDNNMRNYDDLQYNMYYIPIV